MESERLRYRRLGLDQLEEFHNLVQDDHVRRYLFDGQLLPIDWSVEAIRRSQSLFDRRSVGIWLVSHRVTAELIGFCGFVEFAAIHREPQLVYAIFRRFLGAGYATEMARTCIAEARHQGFATIMASVDEVNASSLRILDKLGFEQIATMHGAFGNLFLLRLQA